MAAEGPGEGQVGRRIKEFVEIADHSSLDELIARLVAVRDSLPEDAEAELKLRGDDVFGRRLAITYFREQTSEEAEREERYAEACRQAKQRELERLQEELGVSYVPGRKGKGTLRIVA